MVGRTPGKRAPGVLDVTKQLITPPLQPLPSTSPTPTYVFLNLYLHLLSLSSLEIFVLY